MSWSQGAWYVVGEGEGGEYYILKGSTMIGVWCLRCCCCSGCCCCCGAQSCVSRLVELFLFWGCMWFVPQTWMFIVFLDHVSGFVAVACPATSSTWSRPLMSPSRTHSTVLHSTPLHSDSTRLTAHQVSWSVVPSAYALEIYLDVSTPTAFWTALVWRWGTH